MPTMRGGGRQGILAATVIVIAVVAGIERVRVHGRALHSWARIWWSSFYTPASTRLVELACGSDRGVVG